MLIVVVHYIDAFFNFKDEVSQEMCQTCSSCMWSSKGVWWLFQGSAPARWMKCSSSKEDTWSRMRCQMCLLCCIIFHQCLTVCTLQGVDNWFVWYIRQIICDTCKWIHVHACKILWDHLWLCFLLFSFVLKMPVVLYLPAVPQPITFISSFKAQCRLSTKGKVSSKYCNRNVIEV